jgi:ribosome biogenesis GTPase
MELHALGWNAGWKAALSQLDPVGRLVAGRVAREDRGSYVVYCERRAVRAGVSGGLRHRADARTDFPVVGDWVGLHAGGSADAARIEFILPRHSLIARKASGDSAAPQPIAANVDWLLICCGLDGDFNLRRIERYLTMAWACGVRPLVLLTKADQCDDAEARRQQVADLTPGLPVAVLSALSGQGVRELHDQLRGATATLVGSSGVGKSTLINTLLGGALLKTAAVRSHDQRGRHTTTFRQMFLLPRGGLIIDTPGMRELQAWAGEGDVDQSFNDIDKLAAGCRFRDCTHHGEPGCRVQAALQDGELEAGRWESYCKQLREARYLETREDPAALAAQRRKWKVIHKSARDWMRRKYDP